MELHKIPLAEIKTSELNPRKNFEGTDFDGLCASIAEKGVLQPIIVRPIVSDNGNRYEIVAGERRYRAMVKISEATGVPLDQISIPATVASMTDDEAFEIMMIENLQRQDLSDYEEAESFAAYASRRGEDNIENLAIRTGIRPGYIRGRVAIMGLPKYMVKAWQQDKVKAGHLFQLLRIDDPALRKYYFEQCAAGRYSVKEIKRTLDNRSLKLTHVIFDKTDCASCPRNSSRQKKLFAIDTKDDTCMDPECFTQKLRTALTEAWPKTKFYKNDRLSGFFFTDDVEHNQYTSIYSPLPVEECNLCEHHQAKLWLVDGGKYVENSDVCRNKTCAAAMEKRERAKSRGETIAQARAEREPGAPRVAWHGEHFREKFYQNRLPDALKAVNPDSHINARLALYAILRKFPELHAWFARQAGGLPQEDPVNTISDTSNINAIDDGIDNAIDDTEEGSDTGNFSRNIYLRLLPLEIMDRLRDLDKDTLQRLIVEALSKIMVGNDFVLEDRQVIGDHVGINLIEEWRPDEEYLQKKTKAELVEIGNKFGVFAQLRAEKLLNDLFHKSRIGFASLKKSEMIRLFTDTEIDLSGVVPDEIVKGTIWEQARAQVSGTEADVKTKAKIKTKNKTKSKAKKTNEKKAKK